MPNSPLDVFAQFRALDKSIYGTSYHAFQDRFAVFDNILVPVRRTRPRAGSRRRRRCGACPGSGR